MEWEDHHWEESRKHRNIRQSAAPPPKLINLLSSRFWLWREHISAAFTTTGGTSMLKGRELFHSIREGISHSSSRTLQLPPSSKEKQVMGWKSTGRRTKLFSAYTQQWTYECWDLHTNWPFLVTLKAPPKNTVVGNQKKCLIILNFWEFRSVFIALLAFVKMRLFRSVWTIVGIPETNFFLIDSRTVGIRYRD